jgi:hypothetical protein
VWERLRYGTFKKYPLVEKLMKVDTCKDVGSEEGSLCFSVWTGRNCLTPTLQPII